MNLPALGLAATLIAVFARFAHVTTQMVDRLRDEQQRRQEMQTLLVKAREEVHAANQLRLGDLKSENLQRNRMKKDHAEQIQRREDRIRILEARIEDLEDRLRTLIERSEG